MVDSVLDDVALPNNLKLYILSRVLGVNVSGHFLIHLATHLTYHLGQINYHKLLDKWN